MMMATDRLREIRDNVHATNDPASAFAVLDLIAVIEEQAARIAALEKKVSSIRSGPGGALYGAD